MIAWLLAACTGADPGPSRPAPDADTTRIAIDTLCKLFEGADRPCEREPDGVRAGEHRLGVRAELFPIESALGMVTLRGLVHVDAPSGPIASRIRGFGGNKGDALARAAHEWGVVYGVAIADRVLDPDARPALAAIEPGREPDRLALAGHRVLRGWPLVRPSLELDHAGLLDALAPAFADREPRGMLGLDVVRQSGEVTVECWVQGEADAVLCEAARGWRWPERDVELRVAYLAL